MLQMRCSSMFVSSIAETFSLLPAAGITQQLNNTVRISEPPGHFWFFHCMSQENMKAPSIIIALISKDPQFSNYLNVTNSNWILMYFSLHMKCISDFVFRRNIRENISLVSSACRHNIILIFQQDKTHKLSHDSSWSFRNTLDEE